MIQIKKQIIINKNKTYINNEETINNMDYRYEMKNEARDFHKRRIAFIILNNIIEFLPKGSSMSHFEYCKLKGMNKEEFNKITRGFYLNKEIVFYKDNFIYDDDVIKEALEHINELAKFLDAEEFEIYFGEIPEKGFANNYHYGRYENGNIIKTN